MMRLTTFLTLCATSMSGWAGEATRPDLTVPEPGTYALLGIGIIALFIAHRRKK